MRNPFVCQQCLSRLRPSSSLFRSNPRTSIHSQAIQESLPPAWQTRVSSYSLGQNQSRDHNRDGLLLPAKEVQARKYYGRREHVGQRPDRGAVIRLKSAILGAKGDLEPLRADIARVYGLPDAAAREAVGQLKRLLRRVKPADRTGALDDFQTWKLEYAGLLGELTTGRPPTASPVDPSWASFAEDESPSIASMEAAWLQLDQAKRKKLWSRMILSLFESNPRLLPSFVQATVTGACPQNYIVEDLLRLLLLRAKSQHGPTQEDIMEMVFFLLEADTHGGGQLELAQDILAAIVSATTLEKATTLFQRLSSSDRTLEPHTLLQLASRFARSVEHKDLAADILCTLSNVKGFDINSPAAASVCTSLLHLSENSEPVSSRQTPDELFKRLLDHGFRPNLINMSALLRSFCVRRHLDTAWAIFDLLGRYEIEPDSQVYSTLLNASKKAMDIPSIRRIVRKVESQKRWNPVIVNDLLDIIYRDNEAQPERRQAQRRRNNAFRPMLQLYAKFFRLEPLQKLCSFPLEHYLLWNGPTRAHATEITDLMSALTPQPEAHLMLPDTVTLTLMLSASIRSLPKGNKYKAKPLLRHLDLINNLLKNNDQLALSIIEKHGTWIYDIFLRGMLQHQECLQPAVRLVRDMMRRASEEELKSGRNIRHPMPSVHTWTILINGFKNHRKPGVAASMLRIMVNDGGMKPNMVTWNALIGAFARTNNARGAVKAMRAMEQAGLRPDHHTIETLNSMSTSARQIALSLMEASKDQPVLDDDELGTLANEISTLRSSG